ncbi:hypothetical protein AU194_19745 [Mycobacterium sp. GA-2829]|nr:hypothetical protein AU194_19745 [Mycobacterium sp. GA-2829]
MDDIDRAVLHELRRDGRISQEELARRIHVSRPTAARHLSRLIESDGVKVVGVVHPQVQGLHVVGHASVIADGDVKRLAADLSALPDVVFLSITAGAMSLVAEIRAQSQTDFQHTLDEIRRHPSVVTTNTVMYSQILRDVLEPVRVAAPMLDDLDRALIQHLRRNGRASYSDLAEAVDISVTTARTRVRRLLAEQIVRIGVIQNRQGEDNLLRFGIGIRMRGVATGLQQLVEMPELQLVVTSVGRFDVVATVDGVTRDDAADIFGRINALPQVLWSETWMHLQVCKEMY